MMWRWWWSSSSNPTRFIPYLFIAPSVEKPASQTISHPSSPASSLLNRSERATNPETHGFVWDPSHLPETHLPHVNVMNLIIVKLNSHIPVAPSSSDPDILQRACLSQNQGWVTMVSLPSFSGWWLPSFVLIPWGWSLFLPCLFMKLHQPISPSSLDDGPFEWFRS